MTTIDNSLHIPNDIWLSQQMIEMSPSSMVLVDAQQTDMPIIYVNAAFEITTGYRRDEIIGKNCRFLQGDEHNQDGLDDIRTAVRHRTACTVILRNYRKDGSLFWNELRLSPIFNPQGILTHYVGIQNDVTQRIEAETALHDTETRYRMIAENFPNGILSLYDRKLRYIIFDGQGLAQLGLSKDDFEGKRLRDIFPPEIYERDEPSLLATLQGISSETIVSFGDQTYRVYTHPIRNDQGVVINGLVMTQNITAFKQAEEALRQSEERLRATIEAIPDLIFRNHADGTFLAAHASDEALILFTSQAVIGKTPQEILPADVADRFMTHLSQVAHPQQTARFEFVLSADEQVHEYEARIVPAGSDEFITMIRDLTALKQAERQAHTLMLEKARMTLLTDFIRNVSHEFRTPLAIINSSTYLMARLDDADKRTLKSERIQYHVLRITKLVDMLLKMATLDSNLPQRSQIDITKMLRSLGTSHHELGQIHCQIQENIPLIDGYEAYLYDAIKQILDNARQFTASSSPIIVRAYQEEQHMVIEIEDMGIGISEDDLLHIFETFWRKDSAHTTPGLGLGLPLAQKMIELNGGTIDVQSVLGQGSLFHIRLPSNV